MALRPIQHDISIIIFLTRFSSTTQRNIQTPQVEPQPKNSSQSGKKSSFASTPAVSLRKKTFWDTARRRFIKNSFNIDFLIVIFLQQRQCLFPHEKKAFNGKYTRSECLLTCKIRSVNALCDCIPFQLPPPAGYAQTKICTLEHVSCLNKYKSMQLAFYRLSL